MPTDKVTFVAQLCERMQKCVDDDDQENAHYNADHLLADALQIEGGYEELLRLYGEVGKWYA